MVMKDRPKRDRIIKVGKDHQAIIPESFINEYECTTLSYFRPTQDKNVKEKIINE